MPVEKKLKTFSIDHEGMSTTERLVIDLTSSKRKKDEAARLEPVTPTMLKVASTIADKIAQHRGSIVPRVPKSVPRLPLRAKFGSPLERLATMKSDKVDSTAKVVPRPIHHAVENGLPAEKDEAARVGSCQKSTKPVSTSVEICTLLKLHLLEDMDACAKLVDGVRRVVCPSSFAKHTTQYRRIALLAIMQKTMILTAESMILDQEDTKAAKDMTMTMAGKAYSSAEKIKKLDAKIVALKGSDISAPTYFPLETTRQEIVDLKNRLDAIQVKYESAEKEIGCYIPQIQDLKRATSKLCSAAYANDE
ncbi:hypothetical protein ACFX2I_014257 [Malus domestica]